MKQTILTNWTFSRGFRLIIGIGIIVQAILSRDLAFSLVGLLFSSLAVFNVGCCGSGGCAVPTKNFTPSKKDSNYEEVV
ncbi:hypothetical protein ADIARSV_3481 [Arcticibacter svalbardensis MN12-7]|uniref:DUF2892 domain-containing protein n=1 Tax=Arcticibacter svalbardensis MN12-7 TaxID=1150600 RepID=R9GNH9_9SPHI|nr:hypothetical protein [Arcticibacter svalbardensis]EOR93402.1 hypothetical protein ADIARSV_3481 [Arcticibacter svalbardensis MN12-7]